MSTDMRVVGLPPRVGGLDVLQRVDGGVAAAPVQRDPLAHRLRRVRDDAVVPHVCEPRLGRRE